MMMMMMMMNARMQQDDLEQGQIAGQREAYSGRLLHNHDHNHPVKSKPIKKKNIMGHLLSPRNQKVHLAQCARSNCTHREQHMQPQYSVQSPTAVNCMDAWIHGCMGADVGRMDVLSHGCMNALMHGASNTVCKCILRTSCVTSALETCGGLVKQRQPFDTSALNLQPPQKCSNILI
ncbi:unnamed protein product [Spodoptera exigua]|nr:unnamed protein product [Spodoptera exigua]